MAQKIGEREKQLRELRERQVAVSEGTEWDRHSSRVKDAIQRGKVAFQDLAEALTECKESGSWRGHYGTWAEACEGEWGISRRHADRLIAGGKVALFAEAGPMGPISENPLEVTKPKLLPSNERQARALSEAPPDKLAEVTEKAFNLSNGKQPHSGHIKAAIAEVVEPEEEEPDPWFEVERLNQELKRLEAVMETVIEGEEAKSLEVMSRRYAQLEARLNDQARLASEATKTATYLQKLLRQIKETLGVERDKEIMPALRGLVG